MKRVLIIAYYWPPAGGPGVQRWLMFVKYFRQFGIEPVVYVPENANYPLVDEQLISEVPNDLEILSTPAKEPSRLAQMFSKKKTKQLSSGIISSKKPSFIEKLLLYIRGNFFIPDARIGWVKPSVTYLDSYLSKSPVDVIISTGPPHSMHLIGMELKKRTSIPWLADFRDPWTTIHYHKQLRLTRTSEEKHKKLEREVLRTADQIVVTSVGTKKEFTAITEKPIEVITNGYDIRASGEVHLDSSFSLAHIGSLLSERNPKLLWEVLSELISEEKEMAQHLEIKLAGAVSDDVIHSLQSFGLISYTNQLGYIAHEDALQQQRNSQVLLLIEMNSLETKAIIPGKLFEYMIAERPVLALGPEGSDMEAILKESGVGRFFNYSNKNELKQELLHMYKAYRSNSLKIERSEVSQYSREYLTSSMAKLLQSI